jgi:predicted component of type VI protein secretion system
MPNVEKSTLRPSVQQEIERILNDAEWQKWLNGIQSIASETRAIRLQMEADLFFINKRKKAAAELNRNEAERQRLSELGEELLKQRGFDFNL